MQKIYFDSIDLQILEKLSGAQNINNVPEGYGILELAKALNIKHKNLKPHYGAGFEQLTHLLFQGAV